MKRIVCWSLILVMLVSMTGVCYGAKAEEIYGLLPVQLAKQSGGTEYLNVMYREGFVYADVYDLAKALGYEVRGGGSGNDTVSLWNEFDSSVPRGFAIFSFTDTKVIRSYSYLVLESYEAPCKAVRNDAGIWLPMDYTVTLMGGELVIQEDDEGARVARITPPTMTVADVFYKVLENRARYQFDWSEDYGYSEETLRLMDNSSNIVNLVNGCLDMDGSSWVAVFQQGAQTAPASDAKYGDKLATLLCTDSTEELESATKFYDLASDATSENGILTEMVRLMENAEGYADADAYVKKLEEAIEEINMPQIINGKTAQKIKRSLYTAIEDDDVSKKIDKVLKDNGYISKSMKGMSLLVQTGGYLGTYYSQDQFAVAALKEYLAEEGEFALLPDMARDVMTVTVDDLSSNIAQYTVKRVLADNLEDWVGDGAQKFLGLPANAALVAWDIASGAIPFFSEGLEATDRFQLSCYAAILQYESYNAYTFGRGALLTAPTAENVAAVSRDCYVYLKSCYLARQCALTVLSDKTDEKVFADLASRDRQICGEIADLLAILKNADENNTGYAMGFLPEDNERYLRLCDDTNLAKLIVVEPYASYTKLVADLEKAYGKAEVLHADWGYDVDILGGLCYVNLVDFDQDGLDELLVAYKRDFNLDRNEWVVHVYAYDTQEQEVDRVHSGGEAFYGGVGGNNITLTVHDGQIYLVTGHTKGYSTSYEYYGYRDGAFGLVRSVQECVDDGVFVIDGKSYSQQQFEKLEEPWFEGHSEYFFAVDIDQSDVRWVEDKKLEILEKGTIENLEP